MRKIIVDMMTMLKYTYPYFAKDTDLKQVAKAWDFILKDIPDEDVMYGFKKALKTCKNPPSPADVISAIEQRDDAMADSPEMLWEELMKALNKADKYRYRLNASIIEPNGKTQRENAIDALNEIFNGLSKPLQEYVTNINGLMERLDYEAEYEKMRFLKALPYIKGRISIQNETPAIETEERRLLQ